MAETLYCKCSVIIPLLSRRPSSTIGIVRTAKAEKRLKDKLREEGLLTDDDEPPLSPAEERALKAEKRAAWRAARLKSLEQDAMQAQMVIKSMTDMVGAGETSLKENVKPIKEEVSCIAAFGSQLLEKNDIKPYQLRQFISKPSHLDIVVNHLHEYLFIYFCSFIDMHMLTMSIFFFLFY